MVDFLKHLLCSFSLSDRLFFFDSVRLAEIAYVNDCLPVRPTRRITAKMHARISGINVLESID